jgi:hypothetical protein
MDKEILNVTDPRDAFMIMLLERIGNIETRLTHLEMNLDKQNASFEISKNASCSHSAITSAFVLTLSSESSELGMADATLQSDCEVLVSKIVDRLGRDSFLTVSAIVEKWQLENVENVENVEEGENGQRCDVFIKINMKHKCFVDKIVRIITELDIPSRHVVISTEKVVRYNAHCGKHSDAGLVYSAYDVDGTYIEKPQWQTWTKSCTLFNG